MVAENPPNMEAVCIWSKGFGVINPVNSEEKKMLSSTDIIHESTMFQ